jgi:hypothetical protein
MSVNGGVDVLGATNNTGSGPKFATSTDKQKVTMVTPAEDWIWMIPFAALAGGAGWWIFNRLRKNN